MNSVRARFLSTDGYGLEARIEVEGVTWFVMDEFSFDHRRVPTAQAEVEFEFTVELADNESWEDIFSGNPEQRIGLAHCSGWTYRAYGQIEAIHPVRVNCGLLVVEDVIHSHDQRVIGAYIAFTLARLGGYLHID